jgi:hypothetical protein
MSEQKKTSILSTIGTMLLSLLGTAAVKRIIVDHLVKLAAKTDNEIDDKIIKLIDNALNNTKDVTAVKEIYEKWSGTKINATAAQD